MESPEPVVAVIGYSYDDETVANDEADGVRGWPSLRSSADVSRAVIPVSQLRDRLHEFVESMRSVLGDLPEPPAGFSLNSIELHAEVSVTGKVSLLGVGGEAGGVGAITLTFERA